MALDIAFEYRQVLIGKLLADVSAGLRLVAYVTLMTGSALSVTKIDDITATVPTA